MKLVILLVVPCLLAGTRSYAQSVTFTGKNVPLTTVFAAIKSQAGHVFFFDARLLRDTKPVSLDVHDAPVAMVLKESLKDQPLDYSIENKTVTIEKKAHAELPGTPLPLEDPPPVAVQVSGTVRDSADDTMAGVSIRIKGGTTGTITDAGGRYNINAEPG